MKVLVADDTRTNLLIVKKYIENAGHEVITAEDGLQAIDLFNRTFPDLVLLDIMMPNMNGFDAARQIRQECERRERWIPIIFLSAMGEDEDIAKGIEVGGDDYLTKPVSRTVLNAKLKAMARIADMQKQLDEANRRLRELSEIDPLTKIANRRRFD
ncbi:MAG: response regulator, partial [Methylococcales bacterium]